MSEGVEFGAGLLNTKGGFHARTVTESVRFRCFAMNSVQERHGGPVVQSVARSVLVCFGGTNVCVKSARVARARVCVHAGSPTMGCARVRACAHVGFHVWVRGCVVVCHWFARCGSRVLLVVVFSSGDVELFVCLLRRLF